MHINFDDEGLIVNSIQLFLKENLNVTLNLSGVWDTDTHEALIQYLQLPNTYDIYEFRTAISNKFTYRQTRAPYSLVDGGGIINFEFESTPYSILLYTKPTSQSYENGLLFISQHIEELNEFAKSCGWSVSRYSSFGSGEDVSGKIRAEILLEKTGVTNYFPHKEVMPMVNLFRGTYLYNQCFIGNVNEYTDKMQHNTKYKIAVIPCAPGDTFTITHGYSMACEMAFGFTDATIKELKNNGADVSNVVSRLENSLKGPVKSGSWDYYEIPEDSNARYLLVQMPYREDLISHETEITKILLGDVNLDGVVDQSDVDMLNEYVTLIEEGKVVTQPFNEKQLIAANVTRNVDIEGKPVISREDVTYLQIAVTNGDSLGTVEYTNAARVPSSEKDRLLVMSGEQALQDELNVPVNLFSVEPWAVHSKFIEYFLGRVIHKYSDIEDISWLQENIRHIYSQYGNNSIGTYDEVETYSINENIKYDQSSGTYRYYKGKQDSGLIVVSDDKFKTGKLLNIDGSSTSLYIDNHRLYDNGEYMERYIMESGVVCSSQAENSLKCLVKKFQDSTNQYLEKSGYTDEMIYWTYGNYCVDTDNHFIKALNKLPTYKSGWLR